MCDVGWNEDPVQRSVRLGYEHVLVHANDDVLPVAATPVPAGQFVHDDLPVSEL